MQLPEADAYTILQTHCSVLHGRLVFLPREHYGACSSRRIMAVECLQLTDMQLQRGFGLGVRLRVALDIMNAMCSCPGLEPHVNLRFWRHAVCSLWVKYPKKPLEGMRLVKGREVFTPELCEFLPFEAAAFSQFSICVLNSDTTGLTERVCLLWRQLAGVSINVNASKPSAALDALVRVRSFVPSQRVRPLRLMLHLPLTSTQSPPRQQLEVTSSDVPVYVSAIKAIGAHVARNDSAEAHVDWSLELFPHLAGSLSHLSWLRRLASAHAHVPISLLALLSEPAAKPQQAHAMRRSWGQLLTALVVEKKTLRSLMVTWRDPTCEKGGVFSLIPRAASTGMSLTQVLSDGKPDTDFWHWLAFALLHPETERQACESFMMDVRFDAAINADVIKTILTTKLPLRPIAKKLLAVASVADYHLQWLQPGETIARVLTPDAGAFSDPECVSGSLLTVLVRGAELDIVVVVPSPSVVGVVVPAYGLCWIAADTVAIERTGRWTSARDEMRGLQTLRELMCVLCLPRDLYLDVELVQLSLVSLTVTAVGIDKPITAPVLRTLLASCPNLRRLKLDGCTVYSIEPLISAYANRLQPCRISALDLRIEGRRSGARLDLVPLIQMLSDPLHPSARVLTQFAMDRLSWLMLQDFRNMLRVNRSLVQVSFGFDGAYPRSLSSEEDQKAAIATLLDPFQGQVLVDGCGPRFGLLSVIRRAHQGEPRLASVLSRLDAVMLAIVFEFVGCTVLRHRRPGAYRVFDA